MSRQKKYQTMEGRLGPEGAAAGGSGSNTPNTPATPVVRSILRNNPSLACHIHFALIFVRVVLLVGVFLSGECEIAKSLQ